VSFRRSTAAGQPDSGARHVFAFARQQLGSIGLREQRRRRYSHYSWRLWGNGTSGVERPLRAPPCRGRAIRVRWFGGIHHGGVQAEPWRVGGTAVILLPTPRSAAVPIDRIQQQRGVEGGSRRGAQTLASPAQRRSRPRERNPAYGRGSCPFRTRGSMEPLARNAEAQRAAEPPQRPEGRSSSSSVPRLPEPIRVDAARADTIPFAQPRNRDSKERP